MTRRSREQVRPSVRVTAFPTIDREKRYDGERAATEMVNFRKKGDGSIEKRCGYSASPPFPEAPRAVYTGFYGGKSELYLLAGRTVYRRFYDDEYGYVSAGQVKSEIGDAAFVELGDGLWLFDGDDVYLLSGEGRFESIEGYIPLYGKDWDPLLQGDVYESENYLTPRVRIRFLNPQAERTVYFGRRVASIHRVWLDGEEIDRNDVELVNTGGGATAEVFRSVRVIELLVTLDTEDERRTVTSARRATVYGGAEDNRLLLWDAEDKNVFYASTAVSGRDARRSDALGDTTGGALYFPKSAEHYRLDAPITATCRFFDRLLIFTPSGTWAAEYTGGRLSVASVHTSVGCDEKDCAVLAGDAPVSLSGGHLFRWNARASVQRECTAERISGPISEQMRGLSSGQVLMQYYPARSELWIAERESTDGRVLVYSTESEGFYTYEGIFCDRLVPSGGDPVFTRGRAVYALSEDCTKDEGREIRAYYRSGWIDFGLPERKKRLVGISLFADPDGDPLTVCVEGENGRVSAVDLYGEDEITPALYYRRMNIGRLRSLRYGFETVGEGRPSVSSLVLRAR